MSEKSVKWTCPHCNNLHYYYWDEDDIFEGECNMICNSCRNQSKQMMYIDSISGNAWCRFMKEPEITKETKDFLNSENLKNFVDNLNPKSELEQLKKQAEEIQQRIEELEEQQKKEKYKSLHNVIAKWEFYYSEKLEKRIMYGMHSGNVSYRDIVKEEIDNLLKGIEKWIDTELSFNKITYTPEYFIGWDECRKAIKKKLRSDSDFYGKTK
jgi:hypothetical protein